MSVRNKIEKLLEKLNDGVIEKEKEISMTLLSAVAGESIFLLGAPGVAKSLIARRLNYAFKDGTSFEYLMNRFSTPDEIFGPVSISKLKNEDKYERIVKNYLPSADVVFLDEIWKAGPSIQNALLTVVNEKIYRNGEQEIKIPMKALISASNELPATGEGLDALWDRFLIRLTVEGVSDKNNFNNMISKQLNSYKDSIEENLKITEKEYGEWSKEIDKIEVPENILNVIHFIRSYISEYNKGLESNKKEVYISDRRWRKIVRLLRTSAFLNDRKSVDLMDCFIIRECLWDDVEQMDIVASFVKNSIEKHGYSFSVDMSGIIEELRDFQNEIKEETKFVKDTRKTVPVLVEDKYYEIEEIDENKKFIKKEDFDSLDSSDKDIYLYRNYNNYGENRIKQYSYYDIKKGSSEFSLEINHTEYKIKTRIDGEKRTETRRANPKLEALWNEQVEKMLDFTGKKKQELEEYRKKDFGHLRTNLFVDSGLAEIVESHINNSKREIEKIEIDIRKTQNDYKNMENNKPVESL